MKKVKWQIEGDCCPNCGLKIEEQIACLEGVSDCKLSVMAGLVRVTLDESREQEIFNAAENIFAKIEPSARVLAS